MDPNTLYMNYILTKHRPIVTILSYMQAIDHLVKKRIAYMATTR